MHRTRRQQCSQSPGLEPSWKQKKKGGLGKCLVVKSRPVVQKWGLGAGDGGVAGMPAEISSGSLWGCRLEDKRPRFIAAKDFSSPCWRMSSERSQDPP